MNDALNGVKLELNLSSENGIEGDKASYQQFQELAETSFNISSINKTNCGYLSIRLESNYTFLELDYINQLVVLKPRSNVTGLFNEAWIVFSIENTRESLSFKVRIKSAINKCVLETIAFNEQNAYKEIIIKEPESFLVLPTIIQTPDCGFTIDQFRFMFTEADDIIKEKSNQIVKIYNGKLVFTESDFSFGGKRAQLMVVPISEHIK